MITNEESVFVISYGDEQLTEPNVFRFDDFLSADDYVGGLGETDSAFIIDTPEKLKDVPKRVLVAVYNKGASVPVKNFRNVGTAAMRVQGVLQTAAADGPKPKKSQDSTTDSADVADKTAANSGERFGDNKPKAKPKKKSRKTTKKTDKIEIAARSEKKAPRAGSKTDTMLQVLDDPGGATLAKVIATLNQKGTPCNESSAKSWIRYLGTHHGYGIETINESPPTYRVVY